MFPLSLLTRRVSDSAKDLGVAAGSYAAIGIIVVIGVGFLLAAGFMLLADMLGAIAAAAIFGAVLLLIAAIWGGILAAQAREKARRRKEEAAQAAMVASGLSLANTGLRLASRTGGRFWLPALGIGLALMFLRREGD